MEPAGHCARSEAEWKRFREKDVDGDGKLSRAEVGAG
jgi:hypothetical protein